MIKRIIGGTRLLMVLAMMIVTASFVTAQEENVGLSLAGGKLGEINLKFGYIFESSLRGSSTFEADPGLFMGTGTPTGAQEITNTEITPLSSGISLGAEYLYAIPLPQVAFIHPGFLKIGVGGEYLFPIKAYGEYGGGSQSEIITFSLLPIYGIVQVNPSKTIPGLFLRGSIGYTLFLDFDQEPKVPGVEIIDRSGGLYWGVSAGYEFDWGLFVECTYAQARFIQNVRYDPSLAALFGLSTDDLPMNLMHNQPGFSIGYKIKL